MIKNILMAIYCVGIPSQYLLATEIPQAVTNTQAETSPLLTAEEARAAWQVPEGFQVSLFAHEPDVRQPIAMTFDSRGRIWVAENDTYAESSVGYDLSQHDRIIILEDTNGDGTAESRKVFWDQGQKLTSVELGFGGVWALCAPHLLFIPDANGDDIPDGPAQVVLEGFDGDSIRHNIVNGLKWGPDGWLYGRHGITTTSFVGLPGSPVDDREKINCGIWRYHPTGKLFEVVCRGGTNAWGHDWDENGELFFINTVIGHLWHGLPGAHVERMFGDDFNPHLYELMPQTADHFHWDTNEKWSDIRNTGVTITTDAAGGGHAHCGMMIYQGLNWPEQYRGKVFTCNLHGLRINCDHIEFEGSSFTAHHEPDFAKTKDVWFRGIDLTSGPDGSVYVLDWSDIGECHDNDGIHRTSGRIYKITHGTPKPIEPFDLTKLSNNELVALHNPWDSKMARRILQERAVEGQNMAPIIGLLTEKASSNGQSQNTSTPDRIAALANLQSIKALQASLLQQLLNDPDEIMQSAAVRILSDREIEDPEVVEAFKKLSASTESGRVQLRLASALQRLPHEARLEVAANLATQKVYAHDKHLPLMIWYGVEPTVLAHPDRALQIAATTEMPLVRKFIARRIASEFKTEADSFAKLVALLSKSNQERALDMLSGITAALDGWRQVPAPQGWEHVVATFGECEHEEVQRQVRELSVVFGDGRAIEELRKLASDGNETLASRRNAIAALAASRDAESIPLMQTLLQQRDLAKSAVQGLAAFDNPGTPELVIQSYNRMYLPERPEAIESLASRPAYALALLEAVEKNRIPRQDVSPFFIRQMRSFSEPEIQEKLEAIWPDWRHTSEEKLNKIEEYKALLTPERIAAANPSEGRALFQKNCVNCHTLFGTGGKLAPDLTGAQRQNLTYLLENIVDPSAQVAEKFRMSILAMDDGRVISGVVIRENEQILTIQTPNDFVNIPVAEIEERRQTALSMMPERMLDNYTAEQVVDLTAYLMSTTQVALPE